MSDQWDAYYLNYADFTNGSLSFVSGGPAEIPAPETNVQLYPGGSDQTLTVNDGMNSDFYDFDNDSNVTYLGTVTLTTDTGSVTAIVGEETFGSGPNLTTVVALFVPHGAFSSESDMSSHNATVSAPNTASYVLPMPCFTAGTMIRTPQGERAVEELRAGDLVLTAEGVAKPIRWAGRSTVSTRFANPARTLPIRIKAGALGESLPARDLLLSPAHAVLLDGALVQAAALVNGTSVVRETRMPASFLYYHLETDAHDVLLAEGVPSESFLLAAEEMRFDNWAERPADAVVGPELAYPRVKAARQLSGAVRELLAQRAAAIAADLDAAA